MNATTPASNANAPRLSGGQILVNTLVLHGVDRVFCVPGESYLAVLDALYDTPSIEVIVCRHEGAAAMMAEAYGKLTGRPGICFVTRGPGATNASAGVHVALQDSSPMIMFIGQIGRNMQEREAFQEIDYRRMFGPLSKWVAQIDDPARIAEMAGRAFYTATSGRAGPVVLALPEDMLTEYAEEAPARPYQVVEAGMRPQDLDGLRLLLEAARQPLLMLGGGGWNAAALAQMRSFAEAWHLPVCVSFRCQDYFDNEHPNYVGDVGLGPNPQLATAVREADLLIVIGARLGESTTGGYTLIDNPLPKQALVHVYPDGAELGRVYQPTLGIVSGMQACAAALLTLKAPAETAWAARTPVLRSNYLSWTTPKTIPGNLQLGEIILHLREICPSDTIIANGAGNYAIWPNRFYRYRQYRNMLAPTSGSMGYGIPAAIAAKIADPARLVIAFAGDGCFLMNGQELSTAVQYKANIIVIVVNNASYGTIRMHQEREYPGRVSATRMLSPDFAALGRAYGTWAERVEHTHEFAPALQRAMACGKPALLELIVEADVLSPDLTISGLRAKAVADTAS